MKIVADENIPLLNNFFADFGDIVAKPGRVITQTDLKDADLLIVRSVTQVNQSLLEGSPVKFVGSCTIGEDHVDRDYLEDQGIGFSAAPGCNANSVVEYVLSCLSILTESHKLDLDTCRVGIIGYGNVGRLLAKRLKKFGVSFVAYDPFVEQDSGQEEQPEDVLTSLEAVLDCDVVSLHVPLTDHATYPTRHMINADVLRSLKKHQVLINTSRGAVVDSSALLRRLIEQPLKVILDVWENEPNIDVELAKRVYLATPHIAGYSLDGKAKGTEQVYQAVCKFLGFPVRHKVGQFLDEPPLSKMAFTSMADPNWSIHTALRACFDVRHDHSQLMTTMDLSSEQERADAFDALRKNYRCRREFGATKVQLKQANSELHKKFKGLGFNIKN